MASPLGTPEWAAFCAADKAWGEELVKVFGKFAGTARYRPEGKTQTQALAVLYREREVARLATEAIRNAA